MPTCKICGYAHEIMIHFTHIRKHGMTVQEYKLKFPGAALRVQSEESKLKMSASKTGKPSGLKGKIRSEEHSKNISAALKEAYSSGKIQHWNSGNTTPLCVKEKIAQGNRGTINAGNIKQKLKKQERIKAGAIAFGCEVLSCDVEERTTVKCLECKHVFSFTNQIFYETRLEKTGKLCPSCQPRITYSSAGEQELLNFIKSVYAGIIIPNDRGALGGKELDVYLPELKIAFEYTGLYWHAEKQNPINKHLLWKRDFAFNQGVELITVFEDEWHDKQDIVKSRIMNMLGLQGFKSAARKLKIGVPSVKEKNLFLTENHLQGRDTSSDWAALMDGGEIVCIATFKKTSISKGGSGDQWELSRFASKLNTQVQGGASRLVSWFVRKYKADLVSYADSRWSTGKLYRTMGFDFIHRSSPSYWYLLDGYKRRVHRSAFMKHRLVKCEEDKAFTEWELAQQAGMDRIWDCGTTKWLLKYNPN